jgi:hypothetical protein
MARLVCTKHSRARVLVLPSGKTTHRSDRTPCTSILEIGGVKWSANQIAQRKFTQKDLEHE